MGGYFRGLAVVIMGSFFGLWLIYRALTGDTAFLSGSLKISVWMILCAGILLQTLMAVYVCLGVRAGFFG
jgi:hypothetical protein